MKTELKATAEIDHLRGLHKQLASIELSWRHRRAGLLGPRSYGALLAAVAVFASGYPKRVIACRFHETVTGQQATLGHAAYIVDNRSPFREQ